MPGPLTPIDWAIVGAYALFAVGVGVAFARRAGKNVDQFFLSGRTLPWWVAGTSMIATSFAADTPLAITGMVRDWGIWKNWAWWCFAVSGLLQVFLYARWWRRGGVMTKAELVELRYGGRGARVLRGMTGVLHAAVTNSVILAWVLLAAAKISGVLFEVDKLQGLAIGCAIAMSYSLLAGFWGVVVTDMIQFVMAMAGAIVLAFLTWTAIGATEGILAAAADGRLLPDTLRILPPPGDGGVLDASFWTVSFAAVAVYLGVSWWAVENVDGSGIAVQRIAASRDERQGLLATLWFNIGHYALRPWCWILVALASLLILPHIEVVSPTAGTVTEVSAEHVVLIGDDGRVVEVALRSEPAEDDWFPEPRVTAGDEVAAGDLLARTDSERAYVVMMIRFLPAGLLGLVAASLLAAFMSTIDTHVNLAASFFVNDIYRRFLVPSAAPRHYVFIARLASMAVLLIGGLLAWRSESIFDLFLFFFAFLGGVGPVYLTRWLWWRVRASTEIAAMLASVTAIMALTTWGFPWDLGPLTPGGTLTPEGRLILVVIFSITCALVSLLVTRAPDPASLVSFYRRVRPMGRWGPVARLCPDVRVERELAPVLVGWMAGLAATYGLMLGLGFFFLGRPGAATVAGLVAVAGVIGTGWALRRLAPEPGEAGRGQAE